MGGFIPHTPRDEGTFRFPQLPPEEQPAGRIYSAARRDEKPKPEGPHVSGAAHGCLITS